MRNQFLLASLLFLNGCSQLPSVGPDFVAISPKVPDRFVNSDEFTKNATFHTDWWNGVNDPTLKNILQVAFSRNFQIESAQAKVREARAQLGIAHSGFLPSVDLDGSASRTRPRSLLPGILPTKTIDFYSIGSGILWDIDIFGGLRRETEAAEAVLNRATLQQEDAQHQIAAEIVKVYLRVRELQHDLKDYNAIQLLRKKQLHLTESQVTAGRGVESDILATRSLLDEVSIHASDCERQLNESINALIILSGCESEDIRGFLKDESTLPSITIETYAVPSEVLKSRLDIQVAQATVHEATARLGVSISELYPRISLIGNFGWASSETNSLVSSSSKFWSFGPEIKWNLFAGGRITSQIEASEARLDESIIAYREILSRAFADVDTQLMAVNATSATFTLSENIKEASIRMRDLQSALLSAGRISKQDLIPHEIKVLEDSIAARKAQVSKEIARVGLCKALV